MNKCVSVIKFFEHQPFNVYAGKCSVGHIYFIGPGNADMFVRINAYEPTYNLQAFKNVPQWR